MQKLTVPLKPAAAAPRHTAHLLMVISSPLTSGQAVLQ